DRETMSRRGDSPPRLDSNSTGAPYASPTNGERSDEDLILASLVQDDSRHQAGRPGFARQAATTAPESGGAGGPHHAVADSADGPGHQCEHSVLEPIGDGGDWLDDLLQRGRWRAWD